MPRLSLETVFPERQKGTGGKVTTEEFQRSVRCLREAGYARGEYASYIMVGMPGQDLNEVEETVRFAHENGAKVSLAEYSIIPGTRDAELHRSILPSTDPLWHNKSLNLLPGLAEEPRIQQIKETVRRLNASLKRS